jgi:hypothetical protein
MGHSHKAGFNVAVSDLLRRLAAEMALAIRAVTNHPSQLLVGRPPSRNASRSGVAFLDRALLL